MYIQFNKFIFLYKISSYYIIDSILHSDEKWAIYTLWYERKVLKREHLKNRRQC